MSFANAASWQVFTGAGHRKYVTTSERDGFLASADRLAPERRAFCYLVAHSGCRISEALTLTRPQINLEACTIVVRTLKRRSEVFRIIPIPPFVRDMLLALPARDDGRLWTFSRTTAWRIIKAAMDMSGIDGPQACPRGLRHGFGMRAAGEAIPPGVIQRWMGHASLETTQIYLDAQGEEERGFAARMYSGGQLSPGDPRLYSTASMKGIVRRPDRQSTRLASAPRKLWACAAPPPASGLTGFDSRSAGPSPVSPHQAVKWFAAPKRRKTMTKENTSKGNKPTHRIYIVTGEGDKAIWRELGAAWPNKDGKGYNIECTAIPLQGHLVMREIKAKSDDRQGALV